MTDPERDGLLLAALLDAMPDAVFFSDAEGIIRRTNRAAGQLFGYEPDDLPGRSVNDLMPPALSERHDGFMQHHLETGKSRIIGRGRTVEALRKDGTTFPLQIAVGRAAVGSDTHFIAVMHDLSQRIAAEEALSRTARRDAIGQMTSGISHDFSNILTVILGNLEMLEARLEDSEAKAMLGDALEAAETGAALTADLSAFARSRPVHFDPTDINAACSAAVALIRRTFDPKYRISVHLRDEPQTALVDPAQLQSALINIALNARDAMPDGGELIIRTEEVIIDDDYIAQELDVAEGAYVRVSMTDNGPGMGADTQRRVFDPYFTTKPLGHGTGLGLAMVYGFVRQCGGHVTVYSEVGRGTTIALYFPILDELPRPKMPAINRPRKAGGPEKTVLVVEDNEQIRKLASARIKELGYDVREADRGDVAARLLKEDPGIDAVFSDLVMPGELDGLALARHIVSSYPNIRILLTSGYAEDILSHPNESIDHQILRKPYRQSDLEKALSALFEDG